MEVRQIMQNAIIFDRQEMAKLLRCLDYCHHRLEKHPDCGLTKAKITIGFVDYMKRILKEEEK